MNNNAVLILGTIGWFAYIFGLYGTLLSLPVGLTVVGFGLGILTVLCVNASTSTS